MTSKILVTGATGYVGGRLAPYLAAAGYPVRCLSRDHSRLSNRSWRSQVEVVEGDALDRDSLVRAMQGTACAFYLIHGMQGSKIDAPREAAAARNFAWAAGAAGLERVIYLGELADPRGNLSPYLQSRHQTGDILREGKVALTEFRAGMIIGAGSVLFEMIRYLTERQPVLVCPRWFYSLSQPIHIQDVLRYLAAALERPESAGELIEIGGETRLTYADMLREYARERRLKRLLVPAPVFSPRLSAYWVHMVSPIHWRQILPLIEGLRVVSMVETTQAGTIFPEIIPLNFRSALKIALDNYEKGNIETSWNDSMVSSLGDLRPVQLTSIEGMLIERRLLKLKIPPKYAFKAYTSLGGERGWLYLDWTWELRGWVDKLIGGVGLRRGRRHPDDLRPGESLDFWRVEDLQQDRSLRLQAEMLVPGKAWLEFQSIPQEDGSTLLTQTAYFAPRGFWGLLYWYALYPIHGFIFSGMIRKIGERAGQLFAEETARLQK